PSWTRRGQVQGVMVGLAQPALVGRARSAQFAHRPPPSSRQEHVGLLPAQEPALAHVAGDVRLGSDDHAGGHGKAAYPTRPLGSPSRAVIARARTGQACVVSRSEAAPSTIFWARCAGTSS